MISCFLDLASLPIHFIPFRQYRSFPPLQWLAGMFEMIMANQGVLIVPILLSGRQLSDLSVH